MESSNFALTPECINDILKCIEQNSSNIFNIRRIYELLNTIINIITLNGITFENVRDELTQLKVILEYDTTKLTQILHYKDIKQYNALVKQIKKEEHDIKILSTQFSNLLDVYRYLYNKIIQKTIKIKKEDTQKYCKKLKQLNILISRVNKYGSQIKKITYIINPSRHCPRTLHLDFHTSASIFKVDQQTYEDDGFDENEIELHKSRSYSCSVPIASLFMFINELIKNGFPLIHRKKIHIEEKFVLLLNVECICTKKSGEKCNTKMNIDEIITEFKEYLSEDDILELERLVLLKKNELVKKYWGVSICTQCPTPDCQNGNGFIDESTVMEIGRNKFSQHISPIIKCGLCQIIFCKDCGKSHPGKLCEVEGEEELPPNIKRCPKCRIPTERIDGCFHMTCDRCNVHWCFECNHFTDQADAYSHHCLLAPTQQPIIEEIE